jgi:flagellar basal-body rod modification protein FlgD
MNEEQALQAANLVGKSVLIPSGKGILGAGADDKIEGELTLPAGAANVTVRVLDRSGAELRAIDLGAQDAGQVPFDWDGLVEGGMRANPGLYTIKAEAQIDGKTTALDTQVRTPVESVKLGGATGIEVDLGVLGKHALKDVQEIL